MIKRNAQHAAKVTYWVHGITGEMMIAPDARMKPFIGWNRFECNNASEVESFSRRFARQEFEKFKGMKVEEHLRAKTEREKRIANCKLRLAKGCVSALDEQITRRTLENLERKDQLLYKLLTEEPDLSRSALEIEKYEEPQLRSNRLKKFKGLRDSEVDSIARLVEATK